MDSYQLSIGFERCNLDGNVYYKKIQNIFIVLALYVDDLFIFSNDFKDYWIEVKNMLEFKFQMTYKLGFNFNLGLEVMHKCAIKTMFFLSSIKIH